MNETDLAAFFKSIMEGCTCSPTAVIWPRCHCGCGETKVSICHEEQCRIHGVEKASTN